MLGVKKTVCCVSCIKDLLRVLGSGSNESFLTRNSLEGSFLWNRFTVSGIPQLCESGWTVLFMDCH